MSQSVASSEGVTSEQALEQVEAIANAHFGASTSGARTSFLSGSTGIGTHGKDAVCTLLLMSGDVTRYCKWPVH